ncbi:MAG TPA: glycosyltransferase family 4 protein [Candidatus Binatia bacterium]|nr:glycosyltransferase family 4 protein [Candidatus Binatia bacterium]
MAAGILVLANEHVNRRMAGPSIRCFELARVLSADGHRVTLASPFTSDLPPQPFALTQYDASSLPGLVAEHGVVILQGWVMERFPFLRDAQARLVVDLYDPFPLEVLILFDHEELEKRLETQRDSIRAVTDQVRDGDFFLCASEKQRDYWLGWLTAAGRVNPRTHERDPSLRSLIDVVPFGVPAEPPQAAGHGIRGAIEGIGDGDVVALWGGGIYNWFDPVTLIQGVALAAPQLPQLRLVFMSTGHPNPEIQRMWTQVEARRAADQLGLTGRHVFFNDTWVAYEDRTSWLLDADIGVSTHFDHVETRFSFRTRILDYLWAALPVICTAGDTLADDIERRGIGVTVAPESPEAVAAALLQLGGDPAHRRACAARATELAATLTWPQVAEPLRRYCADPRPAADREPGMRRMPVPFTPTPEDKQAAATTPPKPGLFFRCLRAVYQATPAPLRESRVLRRLRSRFADARGD